MRKLLYRTFGGLDVLELAEVAVREPAADEILVRVKAAGVNPVDWKMREGQVKFLTGWRMPQGQGLEFAGTVERVGRSVTGYTTGDEVFGAGKDCIADYCIAKAHNLAKKPASVSFAIASTIPCVGTTAASAFKRANIGNGTEVLVNGATGGIGMFATQMAIARGASVTAVVSEKGVALVEGWGVARVLNYRDTNILDEGRRYDVVLELSDKLPFSRAKSILKPGGTFVASLPNPAELIPGMLGNLVSSRKYALMGMRAKSAELSAIVSDVAAGRLQVVVGKSFRIEEFREAYSQSSAGKVLGKSVFVLDDNQ